MVFKAYMYQTFRLIDRVDGVRNKILEDLLQRYALEYHIGHSIAGDLNMFCRSKRNNGFFDEIVQLDNLLAVSYTPCTRVLQHTIYGAVHALCPAHHQVEHFIPLSSQLVGEVDLKKASQ